MFCYLASAQPINCHMYGAGSLHSKSRNSRQTGWMQWSLVKCRCPLPHPSHCLKPLTRPRTLVTVLTCCACVCLTCLSKVALHCCVTGSMLCSPTRQFIIVCESCFGIGLWCVLHSMEFRCLHVYLHVAVKCMQPWSAGLHATKQV